ncbi:MAG: hypothetical protein ACE5FC_02290 [Myxococcota bacterium]
MHATVARAAAGKLSREAGAQAVASRVIDASLVAAVGAMPLLARGGEGGTFVILSMIAVVGVITLYQRGSRAKRLARFAWLLFFAIAAAAFLAGKALAPVSISGGAGHWAALGVRWALVAGLAAWVFKLICGRRAPRISDAFDWGAALSIGVLLVSAATFSFLGDRSAAGALAAPCAVLGMHFVVREQSRTLDRARRFTQIVLAAALLGLAGWTFA